MFKMYTCSDCGKHFISRSFLLLHKGRDKCPKEIVKHPEVIESNDIEVMVRSCAPEQDLKSKSDDDDNKEMVDDSDGSDEEDHDDSDADPTFEPDNEINKRHVWEDALIHRYSMKTNNPDGGECSRFLDQPVAVEDNESGRLSDRMVSCLSAGDKEHSQGDSILQKRGMKRKKGIKVREEEKKKKEMGLEYTNRKGQLFPERKFQVVTKCCIKKCFEVCNPEYQGKIYSEFLQKSKQVKDEILGSRINILNKKVEKKGRGKDKTKTHDRLISTTYMVSIGTERVKVCKTMFMGVHGISRGKVDILIQKLKASETGFVESDFRGKHTPPNKKIEERKEIREFIELYPRHISHYSRRKTIDKIYLPSYQNIKKMFQDYKRMNIEKGKTEHAEYDLFRSVFNSTGYKFKQPYLDTCKTCDQFLCKKRHASNNEQREKLSLEHEAHLLQASMAYECKRRDKQCARDDKEKAVLVFDLQQVLSSPSLSTNIAYYKRMLSTYNLTIRDCTSENVTECFMWHEAVGGRGSDQIASCLFKKLMGLPDYISHIITYSDTTGGQNRNINMASMFSFVMKQKPSLKVIDQKFLLPGHTRLECDSDHARIERAKKQLGDDFKIMIPRDWYQFVRNVPGKKKFKVTEMTQDDFLAFSTFFQKDNVFIKRGKQCDTENERLHWLKIKWLRYTDTFGVIDFKYDLEDGTPFRRMDLRRKSKGRTTLQPGSVPLSYKAPVGINPLKKKDLLSMLSLIDKDCHSFYKRLPTSGRALEFDELQDNFDSDSDTDDGSD